MKTIDAIADKQLKNVPGLKPGDTVRVHTKIIEGNKERLQVFEGIVIRVKGSGVQQTFTVRKISYGIGVERTFLIHSPKLAKIEIRKRADVRRAYLTYLRDLRGKAAKLKDKRFDSLMVNVKEEELNPEDLAPAAEDLDTELTELNTTEIEDNEIETKEVSIEDIAKAEDKEADAEDAVTLDEAESDHQEIQEEETAEGLDKAENDLEHGKDGEGSEVEENAEAVEPEKEEE
jgi:large subunit ribosomal protein L19